MNKTRKLLNRVAFNLSNQQVSLRGGFSDVFNNNEFGKDAILAGNKKSCSNNGCDSSNVKCETLGNNCGSGQNCHNCLKC